MQTAIDASRPGAPAAALALAQAEPGPQLLAAHQQLAVDQGATPLAAAHAFDLQRLLDARSPTLRGRLARALTRTEHFVGARHAQLSALDRELLLHWMDEAGERLAALRRASPAVERLLRALARPLDPLQPTGCLARTLDLQQAIVDAEVFLDSRRGQQLAVLERHGLEAAVENARAWLATLQG